MNNIIKTQHQIKYIKDHFERRLAKSLLLTRVSAPLFVLSSSGLNDNLSGTEKAISFKAKDIEDDIEIVQSLAKWKRFALAKYDIKLNNGIYTDMNAIRKDETIDNIHSLYVDQWDWEIAISHENRNIAYLQAVVKKIYRCIYKQARQTAFKYHLPKIDLPKKITFIDSSELLNMYPKLSAKEREYEITKKYKAVFISKIGYKLKDGKPHDVRAADYDDWKLNGDILVYNKMLDIAFELSSMGIRVNKESLVSQIKDKNEEYKLENKYCQAILNDKLPLSIGGGIGQSRLCMLFLNKKHIGEVQSSLWPDDNNDLL